MAEFRTSEGMGRMVGEELHLDRPDSRWGRSWIRMRRFTDQHPGRTAVLLLGVCLFLLLVLTVYTVYRFGVAYAIGTWHGVVQYVVAPFGLLAVAVIGVMAGYVTLKVYRIYRQHGIETLSRPNKISMNSVTRVLARNYGREQSLFIFFREADGEEVTRIGFLKGMEDEAAAAKEVFEGRGIPVESGS